jgi:hypothetical protein
LKELPDEPFQVRSNSPQGVVAEFAACGSVYELLKALLHLGNTAFTPDKFIVWIEVQGELIRTWHEVIVVHPSGEQAYMPRCALQQGVGHVAPETFAEFKKRSGC